MLHVSEARAGALSSAWEAIGGGPADLFFPEEFLGRWTVRSHQCPTNPGDLFYLIPEN